MKKKKFEVIYYPTGDRNWDNEVSSIMGWLDGKGLDIGCGGRSINSEITRLDIDPKNEPDICSNAEKMPIKDNEFDFVYGIHAFEHLKNPVQGLKEWLRVVKKGGVVMIIHPDIDHTKKQNKWIDNPGLRENPYNKHWFEHNLESFLKWLNKYKKFGFKIMDSGVALENWSFYVVLRKNR